LQPIAQPLHHRAADEDAAFQRELALPADLPCHCGEQALFRGDGLCCRYFAAGNSRCRKCSLRGRASRTSVRRAPPADRRPRPRWVTPVQAERRADFAVDFARGTDLRQHARGDAEKREQLFVPCAGAEVVEHRARGVAGSVTCTWCWLVSFQMSHVSTVPKMRSARFRLRPGAGDVIENPRDLCRGEIGIQDEPGARWMSLSWPAARSSSHMPAVRRSCQTMALQTASPVCDPRRWWSRVDW
jgi:hypothetical protein